MSSTSSRRVASVAWCAVALIALSSRHVLAQDIVIAPVPLVSTSLETNAITVFNPRITPQPVDVFSVRESGGEAAAASSERSAALIPLYVSFGSLQAFDVKSTLRATGRGARESNPVVRSIIDSPPALVAMKAGSTVAAIYLTEHLRKRHPIAAVVLMVGFNAGYAGVVAHNYSVSARLNRPSSSPGQR